MTLSSAELAILDLAVEDSYALSELVSRVHATQPSLSLTEARRVAREATKSLLDRGLVQLRRRESVEGPEVPIDQESARRELDSELAWLDVQHWRPHVRVVATQEGDNVLGAS